MNDLTSQSASKLALLIRERAASPVEIMEAHLRRIEQINPALNAIVTLAPDVLERAREAEEAVMDGDALGPLHGVPLTVKDTIETAGLRTTSGSRLRANYLPERDAAAVTRLKAAGAIILGKTNTPEMALPYETDNPVFGRTNNPHDLARTPGGSSGGEAAAISACLSPAGIGSDLSGSIRIPAHFCGIAGLKPTAGRVPMDGHFPPAIGPVSLGACIGPMARCVEDLALLLGVLADATQFELSHTGAEKTDFARLTHRRGLRVAWYVDDGVAPVDGETCKAVEAAYGALRDAGCEVVESLPPGISEGSRLWIELFSRTSLDEMWKFYRGREGEAGPLVASLLLKKAEDSGTESTKPSSAAHWNAAEKLAATLVERERLREQLLRWMERTPLIVAPTGSTHAFTHGARRVKVREQSVSVFRAFSYSQTFNVFGLPAVAVPAGRSREGLPIGVQIVAPPFEEQLGLQAAAIVEEALGGWQKPPV